MRPPTLFEKFMLVMATLYVVFIVVGLILTEGCQ